MLDQAEVLGFYDPDRARSRGLPKKGAPGEVQLFTRFAGRGGTEGPVCASSSNPQAHLSWGSLSGASATIPKARFTFYAPTRAGNSEQGGAIAFDAHSVPGGPSCCKVILSLDNDFLGTGPFSVRYAKDFAMGRRQSRPDDTMSRLYVVETMMSPTGSMADHRLRRRSGEIQGMLLALAAELSRALSAPEPIKAVLAPFGHSRRPGRSLSHRQGPCVARGCIGGHGWRAPAAPCSRPRAPCECPTRERRPHLADRFDVGIGGGRQQSLVDLAMGIQQGFVDTPRHPRRQSRLHCAGRFGLPRCLAMVPTVLYLGPYENETAASVGWFIPAAHRLESWGDAAAYDGTLSLVQPLMTPLYGGRIPAEVLSLFSGVDYPDGHRLLRALWAKRCGTKDADAFWQATLKAGIVAGSGSPKLPVRLAIDCLAQAVQDHVPTGSGAAIEVSFLPDPCVHDGQFANNPWLQELPKPMTKLTWDNAAMMSTEPRRATGLPLKMWLRWSLLEGASPRRC